MNSLDCTDSSVENPWEVRFREEYSEIYPAVKETSKRFVGSNAIVIMPSQYRKPVFWRDLSTDLDNIRGLPDNGELLRAVVTLLNGERLCGLEKDKECIIKTFSGSFWTLLVVLENIKGGRALLDILCYSPSFLDYASDEAIKGLDVGFHGPCHSFYDLGEESYLYILQDKRIIICAESRQIVFESSCDRGYTKVVRLLLDDLGSTCLNINEMLCSASRGGHPEVVRLLLADGRVDPTAHNNKAIHAAKNKGNLEVFWLLLADNRTHVDPHSAGFIEGLLPACGLSQIQLPPDRSILPAKLVARLLRVATKYKRSDIVRYLLDDPTVPLEDC